MRARPQVLSFSAQTRAARLVTVLTENPPARHTEFSLGTGVLQGCVQGAKASNGKWMENGSWKMETGFIHPCVLLGSRGEVRQVAFPRSLLYPTLPASGLIES